MKKAVAVFGGEECVKAKEKFYYDLAYDVGALLAKRGFIVATGMGPGLMDQTLKGAVEAGGETIGVGTNIPGRTHSIYVTRSTMHEKLDARQEKLLATGDAYIVLPGGVGTLYELSDVMVLKNIGQVPPAKPLVLVTDYFRPFDVLIDEMIKEGFLHANAKEFYVIVPTAEEAVETVAKALPADMR